MHLVPIGGAILPFEIHLHLVYLPFSTNGAKMLQHTKSLLEDKDTLIVIDKRFDKLLTALRTAVAREYKLDKEQTHIMIFWTPSV